MPPAAGSLTPTWTAWGTAAFTRASAESRPVLLFLFARWSAACTFVETQVLAAPVVQAILTDRLVAIRVDVDERPDIADRYGLGGWPTVLVLTPEGDVLTGGQPVDADGLASSLTRITDVFQTRRTELLRAAVVRRGEPWRMPVGPGAPVDAQAAMTFLDDIERRIGHARSESTSAFLPHPAVIGALLSLGVRANDRRVLELAGSLLDEAVTTLFDEADGGMWRVGTSDEGGPERVKVLDQNAQYLELFLDGAALLDRRDFRTRAVAIVGFIRNRLRHPIAGFIHARPDEPISGHPGNEHDSGEDGVAPGADGRRFVDATAVAAQALLNAARLLDDPGLGELAMQTIEQVVLAAYQRGAGLAHVLDPEPRIRGLLGDQVAASAVLVSAFEASGMRVYLDLADELMRSVLRKHWHEEFGALQDRIQTSAGAGDVGLLGLPFFPLAFNCLAARVLLQLAARVEDPGLAARARDILGAVAPLWPAAGAEGANYITAVLEAGFA